MRGTAFGRALAQLIDETLLEALARVGVDRLALVALGSYGRAELCPGSDVDVLLLHDGRRDVRAVADALWYPLWDAGFVLGHAARTAKETLRLADHDVETLTALLDVRVVGGDLAPEAARLAERVRDLAPRRRDALIAELGAASARRRVRPGPVAEMLEPNLKEGGGGLRDLHALDWAGWALGAPGGLDTLSARGYLHRGDAESLAEARERLLDLRVGLHRVTGRRADVLALQDQDAVAAMMGALDADGLVRALSTSARRVAWIAADVWDRLSATARGPGGRVVSRDRVIAPGVLVRDERVHVDVVATVDGALVLRAAAIAAGLGLPFDRPTLQRLGGAPPPTWDKAAREDFVALLRTGERAVEVFEALDHEGALVPILPEWDHVRSLPQRNAYHRHTVDRHLLETVAEVAALLDDTSGPDGAVVAEGCRTDLVLLAALLHDLGKGLPGDHAQAGAAAASLVARRMGFADADVSTLEWLVRDHLLMAETASRRDLSDPATIARFAARVADATRLRLLYVLTVADSRATGPAAWGPGKAALLRELLLRALVRFEGGTAPDASDLVPAPEASETEAVVVLWDRLDDGRLRCTVGAPDRPGLLAGVAGALTLEGFDIAAAVGRTEPGGRAVEVFTGGDHFGRLEDDHGRERAAETIRAVLAGSVQLGDLLRERRSRYARTRPSDPAPRVEIALDESDEATVVEIHAHDEVGLLARVAAVFSDQGLDVSVAKVATLGDRVVDVFYVRDAQGKVTDRPRLAALEVALLGCLEAE